MPLTSQTPLLLARHLAGRIQYEAEARGLSQSELARRAGLGRSTVHLAWSGARLVRTDTLAAIALVLEIEVGDLFPRRSALRDYL